jgi:ribosomal protein S18 acetylase RimI-like enzyme
MDFAENYGRQNNYESIRLDAFSKNTRNQRFYEQRGYIRLENVYFLNQSQDPFYCYELIL